MATKEYPLPVVELFNTDTRRDVIDWILSQTDTDESHRLGDLVDPVGKSRESLRKEIGARSVGGEARTPPAIAFGLLDVHDPTADIPHYTVADSPVISLLDDWDGYPLTELFGLTSRQRLVGFYLDTADPTESYSMTGLSKESPVGYEGVRDNIDILVAAGLVREVKGKRGTEYQVATDSEIYAYLRELNEAVVVAYENRTE